MGKLRNIIIFASLMVVLMAASGFWVYKMTLSSSGAAMNNTLGPIYETEEITVNAAESLTHYVKAQFGIEVTTEKTIKELEKKLPLLQDTIITILSSEPLEVMNTSQGKEALKAKMMQEINKFLDKGKVTRIYIKSIIFN